MKFLRKNGKPLPEVIESLAADTKAGRFNRREFLAMASVFGWRMRPMTLLRNDSMNVGWMGVYTSETPMPAVADGTRRAAAHCPDQGSSSPAPSPRSTTSRRTPASCHRRPGGRARSSGAQARSEDRDHPQVHQQRVLHGLE